MSLFSIAHAAFSERLGQFKPHPAHFVADLALRGLLLDLEENALTGKAIVDGPMPHRAYPSARAAFEACQLSLLLATADDYDLEGATAWVHFLRKDAEFARLHGETPHMDGLTPNEWLRAAVEEIADTWESLSAGKRSVVQAACDALDKKPRKPDNWAGLPLDRELASRLAAKARGRSPEVPIADAKDAHKRAYAALSRGAHPRPCLRPLSVSLKGTLFSITLEPRDDQGDRETVDSLLASALNFGSAALNVRLTLPAA